MLKKILIIEDDPGILLSIKDEFESEGYTVYAVGDGEAGLKMLKQQKMDLIFLDIMLPGIDGFEVCKRLRMDRDTTPIIMLTVKDTEIDKVLGLELGADDYVTKPFSLRELLARAKVIFRRTEEKKSDLTGYCFGDIELDFERFEAKRKNLIIDLTPLEFQLLKLFIRNKEKVLSRDNILDKVWGEDSLSVSHRTIDSHIANIRRKIETDPSSPKHIISIHGIGYKFID